MLLQHFQPKQLELIIEGILQAEFYNDGLDERYNLTFYVADYSTSLTVHYYWTVGEQVTFSGNNPVDDKDNADMSDSGHFKILKKESMRKFVKEVMDAIYTVKLNNFETY